MTLYVSDLDGTLLNNAGKLRPRDADMLNRFIEGGTLFSYCTARGLATAAEVTAGLKLKAPVVLMNGVYIYDPITGEYPVRNMFDSRQRELLRKAVTDSGEAPMIFAFIDGRERVSYLNNSPTLKEHLARRKNDGRRRQVSGYDELFEGDVFYAAFIDPLDRPALDGIFTGENGFRTACYTDTYPPHRTWYEVFPACAGKANSVRKLKELTGADELVCFGDNANDIPMFEAADRCYAVGNAIPALKAAATGIIDTNERCGVPRFIEREIFPVIDCPPADRNAPDAVRFRESVAKALERERTTIGTLNEKTIHNALKCYYCSEADHEARIGDFYADGAGENGIFEIQSGNFTYLAKKLSQMLHISHVTVVYPYEKRTHNYAINEQTGEVMSVTTRTENSFSKLFLELYRLKAFLTNPNLTVRVAFLEIDKKTYFRDSRRIRKKGMKKEKCPTAFLSETVLEKPEDYRVFLPEGLPETFTRAQLQSLCRTTDAGLMLSVLEFVGIAERCGKSGNTILYRIADSR
ncbi:MAG: HAD-IIB family hydrolase [Ruminiclostridium sp.]|nr:HAD-IIB family hydrolase [Ruminiclostridium sp.]